MNTPLFSIVIPVYNRADSIMSTLNSVLEQTLKDYECLIIDDGSNDSDQLKSIIDGLNDERFKYIRQENAGGGAARNTGITKSMGKFIAFLDSDDSYLPEKLEKANDFLKNNDNNSNIVLYTKALVDRGVGKYWTRPPRGLNKNENVADYMLRRRGWIPTSTIVAESKLVKEVLFDPLLPCSQDTDFVIRLYNKGAKFLMQDLALSIYMDLPDDKRISTKNHSIEVLKNWIDTLKVDIPKKAYYGHLGWRYSKFIVGNNFILALMYYFRALIIGAYSPKMAAVIFCQIFLPRSLYRNISDNLAKVFSKIRIKSKKEIK